MVGTNKSRACEQILSEDKLNYLIVQEDRKFVKKHWEIVNRLIQDSGVSEMEEKSRKKRGLLGGTLIGGVVGFLATGFSFQETRQLKSHVNKFIEDYNEFKRRQIKFNEDQVSFNQKILEIFKGLGNGVQRELAHIHCKINNLGYYLLNTRRLLEWKSYLYQLYKDVVAGSMIGPISTVIFTKENIEKIS